MRRCLWIVAAWMLLLAPALVSQGVTYQVYPSTAGFGQPFDISLHNQSTQAITASASGFVVLDASSKVIFSAPGGPPATLLPGHTLRAAWSQVNNQAGQVPAGSYSIRMVYQLADLRLVTLTRGVKILDATIDVAGPASPGRRALLELRAPSAPGLAYQTALSFSNGWGVPLPGKRLLALVPDPLFFLSVTGASPLFGQFCGTFDASGQAASWIDVPRDPRLFGTRLYAAFVVFHPASPGGVHSLSCSVALDVQ